MKLLYDSDPWFGSHDLLTSFELTNHERDGGKRPAPVVVGFHPAKSMGAMV